MGIFDSVSGLFKGKKAPAWQRDPIKSVAGQIEGVLDRPFTPYEGTRVAEMNPGQEQVMEDMWAQLERTRNPGSAADSYQRYMNPHMAAIYEEIDRSTAQQMNDWNAAIARAGGAFGTDAGWGVGMGELATGAAREKGLAAGQNFQNAVGMANQDISNEMAANNATAAQLGQQFGMQSAAQQTEQRELDALYQEFLRATGDPDRRAQLAAELLARMQNLLSAEGEPSPFSQAIGPIAAVAGSAAKAYAGMPPTPAPVPE